MGESIRRPVPFPSSILAEQVEREIMAAIRDAIHERMDQRIPPENSQHLIHGSAWSQTREKDDPAAGNFEEQRATAEISTQDIVDGKLASIERFAAVLVEDFEAGVMRNLYATVGRAAEEVGNSVSASEMGLPEAFLEMLRKVEFGVDRTGKVTRPELHLHPDTVAKVIPLLESQGPEFHDEVDRLTSAKEVEALAREAERVARFQRREAVEE